MQTEIYAVHISCVFRKSVQGKLATRKIPPSVSLFIHAVRAVYFVSRWKLHWDHGLIVLFVELIVLFDLNFSPDAWGNETFCLSGEGFSKGTMYSMQLVKGEKKKQ